MNWLVMLVGAMLLGTGLLMMIGVFPRFGGKAGPFVLLFIGLLITAAGYIYVAPTAV